MEVIIRALEVVFPVAIVPHEEECKEWNDESLESNDEIGIARDFPELAVKSDVILIESIELHLIGAFFHPLSEFSQGFDIIRGGILFCPLEGERFELDPQIEDILDISGAELRHIGPLVGEFLDEALMLELDQCLAHERSPDSQIMCDTVLDNRFTRLHLS